ncbi:hypothetical protein [Chryseobacterium sp. sg2396]|uniref:hypothetical protein n=1 Tax=Chryseobacterium sp. sg2396 TaxID=3276280 RepID=UPI0025CE4A4E|nr:hypothetical protein [uncultured Chryseobacterium sp.]
MSKIKNRFRAFYAGMVLLGAVQYTTAQAVGTPYIISTQDIPFSFLSGGTGIESPAVVEQTADGGYITMAGTNSSATGDVTMTSRGQTDMWVVKYDQYGKIEWQRLYGGANFEYSGDLKQTTDGGYIMVAQTNSSGTGDVMTAPANHGGNGDVWVVKLSATGAITWQKILGGTGSEQVKAVLQTDDGGYLIGASTNSSATGEVTSTRSNSGDYDFWVVKLTSTGTLTWQQTYDNPGPKDASVGSDYLYDIAPASDGTGYILTGYGSSYYQTTNAGSSFDYFVVKINLTGTAQWSKLYGSPGSESSYSVTPTSDGGCVVVGYSAGSAAGDVTGTNHGGNDMWILRLNPSGDIVWQKLYGGSGDERAYSVITAADGGYMIAGNSTSSASGDVTAINHGGNDVCVFKLTSAGVIQRQALYGGTSADGNVSSTVINIRPIAIRQTADGGYVVVSTSGSNNSGDVTDANNGAGGVTNFDQWIFKMDTTGNIVWVPHTGQKN